MIIDAHAHIIVPEVTRDAEPAEDWRPHVFWKNGQQVLEHGGRQLTSALREFVRIDAILEAQAAAGVDRVILCPWASLFRYDAGPEDGLRTSRIYNEALSRLAHAHPNRVSTLGTLPLQDPDLAAREMEPLMRLPGMHGVEVAASVRGAYLGDDRFRPFWDAADATRALVFIHPSTRGFEAAPLGEYYMWNSVGNPLETTIAAAHLIMTGMMETHPRCRVLLAHGGGTILALRGRLRHAFSFQPQARSRLREPVDQSLRRFYFDTVTHDSDLLRALVAYAGPDHVVLGSDYPFDMGIERPADAVRSLGLPPADEAKVLGGNVARLLGLEE